MLIRPIAWLQTLGKNHWAQAILLSRSLLEASDFLPLMNKGDINAYKAQPKPTISA